MARIFITGSSDGLGLMAANLLLAEGHRVVLHARNPLRADDVRRKVPSAEAVVVGDLSHLAETAQIAEQVNRLGRFDAVIHNAAVGSREPIRRVTETGLPHLFAVNVLAPYVLTALVDRPSRLVYVSSALHRRASNPMGDLLWETRAWDGLQCYAESKLLVVGLAFAAAARWPHVLSNALEPGWVPTKMGGPDATDDLDQAHRTQAWLATSEDPAAVRSGGYFYHLKACEPSALTHDPALRAQLLDHCEQLSGIALPV